MPRGGIDAETKIVLADLGRRLPLTRPNRLHRQPLDQPRGDVVLEPDAAWSDLALQYLNDERPELLDAGVGDLDDGEVVIDIDDQSAEVIPLGIDNPHGVGLRSLQTPANGSREPLANRLLGQHFIAERQRAKADLGVQRVKS